MMVDIQKLKGKMTEKGFVQADLAQAIGMNRSTLNRKLQTGEDFSIGEANRLAELLQLSKEEAIAIFFTHIVA